MRASKTNVRCVNKRPRLDLLRADPRWSNSQRDLFSSDGHLEFRIRMNLKRQVSRGSLMQINLFMVKRSFPLKYHQGYLDVAMLLAQVVK